MTFFSVILAIVGLALLIVIHEFGHFIVARWCGMKVERFSVGFGNPLVQAKWGDTIFQIAPVPLGGFVQITGLNPHEEFDHDDPNVYPNRPKWMRLAVLVAGPAANYLTAVLLAIPLFLIMGVPGDQTRVAALQEGSPAALSGLKSGDVFQTIDGKGIKGSPAVIEAVKAAAGKPMNVAVNRDGKPVNLTVTATWDESQKRYLMGVHLDSALRDAGIGEAFVQSIIYPYHKSGEILTGLWQMITRKVSANVAGPVGIARAMAAAARRGALDFLSLITVLSIYLGLFNLLPFPALDGGRALFIGIQSLGLRRITAKAEAAVHMVGMVLLLGVFVLVTFNDIRKFVTGEDDVAGEAAKPDEKKSAPAAASTPAAPVASPGEAAPGAAAAGEPAAAPPPTPAEHEPAPVSP